MGPGPRLRPSRARHGPLGRARGGGAAAPFAEHGRRVVRARLADERGQASAELMGMLFWLLLVVLVVWQICLAAWTYTQVSNAARTASRVEGRGGYAHKASRNALSDPLRRNVQRIDVDGHRATVKVRMPLLVPGLLTTKRLTATRSAELPS